MSVIGQSNRLVFTKLIVLILSLCTFRDLLAQGDWPIFLNPAKSCHATYRLLVNASDSVGQTVGKITPNRARLIEKMPFLEKPLRLGLGGLSTTYRIGSRIGAGTVAGTVLAAHTATLVVGFVPGLAIGGLYAWVHMLGAATSRPFPDDF
jgi:hypothetical protein